MTKPVTSTAANSMVSVLDMVSTTANTASKLVSSAGRTVNVFDNFMANLERRQKAQIEVDMVAFYARLQAESARETAQLNHEIQQELIQDPAYATLYAEAFTNLQATIDKLKSE